MWGTCLGHESIVTSTVGADNLKTWCDSKNRTFNLQFETSEFNFHQLEVVFHYSYSRLKLDKSTGLYNFYSCSANSLKGDVL